MISLLPLYFPDGRLVSRRWRWVTWLVVAFCVGATGLFMVRPDDNEAKGIPNPLGIESIHDVARASSMLSIVLSAEVFRLPPGRLGLSEVRNDKQLLIKDKNTLFEGGTLFGRGATLQ